MQPPGRAWQPGVTELPETCARLTLERLMDNGVIYHKRDFWGRENLKFTEPHFRMRKVAGQLRKLAAGRELDLLDIGCGPGALATLLPASLHYYGIDIAIHEPASNLIELDVAENPITFNGMKFDIVVAQGVFEYMGDVHSKKLAEIADLIKDDGKFVCTYQNFAHWRKSIYWAYSNIQQPEVFRRDLSRYFTIEQSFPTAYNWTHGHPNRFFVQAPQQHMTVNIPVIGPKLAVDYYYLCSPLRKA
jgi:SAM-dependent methyltransferase